MSRSPGADGDSDSPPALTLATPEDLPALTALALAAYAKYTPRLGHEPPAMRPDFVGHVTRGEVSVLRSAAGLDAYLVHFEAGGAWVIENIAVAPGAQGKGIGRALLSHAEAAGRDAGCRRAVLLTNLVMTENQALYTRLGWRETGRRPYRGTHVIDYEKPLDGAGGNP
ncbi:MAG: GNAT family N-acetyltransferase [Pseudomonadota bacterium]